MKKISIALISLALLAGCNLSTSEPVPPAGVPTSSGVETPSSIESFDEEVDTLMEDEASIDEELDTLETTEL